MNVVTVCVVIEHDVLQKRRGDTLVYLIYLHDFRSLYSFYNGDFFV